VPAILQSMKATRSSRASMKEASVRGQRSSTACTIRGTSLEGVIGIESLRGLSMPWVDVLESASALAAALGINISQT
jgi:hypothetical protein